MMLPRSIAVTISSVLLATALSTAPVSAERARITVTTDVAIGSTRLVLTHSRQLIYHVRQFGTSQERIEQARALLGFLAKSVPTEDNPYGAHLKREVELFNQLSDAYLYHDHLEQDN